MVARFIMNPPNVFVILLLVIIIAVLFFCIGSIASASPINSAGTVMRSL